MRDRQHGLLRPSGRHLVEIGALRSQRILRVRAGLSLGQTRLRGRDPRVLKRVSGRRRRESKTSSRRKYCHIHLKTVTSI